MPRLARQLLTILASIAAAVLLFTLVVWSRGGFIEIGHRGGDLWLQCRSAITPTLPSNPTSAVASKITDVQFLGVRYQSYQRDFPLLSKVPASDFCRDLRIPFWQILLFAVVVPVILALHNRRHRPRAGVCKACGYDLCASPDRCPECGTPASTGAAARPGRV